MNSAKMKVTLLLLQSKFARVTCGTPLFFFQSDE